MRGKRDRFSSYLPLTDWGLSLPWASISPSENWVHNSGPADFSQVDKACRDSNTMHLLYKCIWRPNSCQTLSRHGFSAISFVGSRFDTSSPTLMILVSSSIKTCCQRHLCHTPFTPKYELQSPVRISSAPGRTWRFKGAEIRFKLAQAEGFWKVYEHISFGQGYIQGLENLYFSIPWLCFATASIFFPAKAQWMTFLGQN